MSTARGVITKAAADVLSRAGSLIVFPIMARCAGADGYGAYGQVNTVVGFVVPIASLGLSGSMVRFFSSGVWSLRMKSRVLRIVAAAAMVSLPAALIIAACSGIINRQFLKWPLGAELFKWGATLIIAGAVQQILLDFLRARQWIVYLSLIQIFETFATIGATAWLLPSGFTIVDLVKAVLVIKLATVAIILGGFQYFNKPNGADAADSFPGFRRMVGFGLPLVIVGLGLWMMNLGDRLVIGHYMKAADLGLYNAVYGMAALIVALNVPLNTPFYPRLMRAIDSGDRNSVAIEIRLFHRYMNIALIPGAVFLALITRPSLMVLGGGKFPATDMLLVALIVGGLCLDQWNSVSHYTLLCSDKAVFTQNVWIGAGLLNVAANVIVVPHFKLHGAACVTLCTYVIAEIILITKASKFIPVLSLYRFDVMLKAAIASAISAAAVFAIWRGNIPPTANGVIICTCVFGAAYLAVMIILKEIGRADLAQLAGAIRPAAREG